MPPQAKTRVRDNEMKKLIAVAALLLTSFVSPVKATTFGFWESSPASQMISSMVTHEDGTGMQISAHLNGDVMILVTPPGWVNDGNATPVRTWRTVITINGTPVQFKGELTTSGSFFLSPVTYKGTKFVRGELWGKSRLVIKTETGSTGFISAKGVQKAWAHMVSEQGI